MLSFVPLKRILCSLISVCKARAVRGILRICSERERLAGYLDPSQLSKCICEVVTARRRMESMHTVTNTSQYWTIFIADKGRKPAASIKSISAGAEPRSQLHTQFESEPRFASKVCFELNCESTPQDLIACGQCKPSKINDALPSDQRSCHRSP